MRRKLLTILLAVTAAFVLTACTQSDSGSSAAGGAVASSGSGSGTVTANGMGNGTGDGAGSGSAAANGSGNGYSDGTASGDYVFVEDGGAFIPENGGAQTYSTESGSAAGGETEVVQAEDGEADTESVQVEENYTDEEFDALNSESESESISASEWNGVYTSEEGETVTISGKDEKNIAFTFTNAGITGTAELKGNQAVYTGDDHHLVVFEYVDSVIEVSVLSEEDYDTSESPLNGTYISQ